jgi:hypothetical protein
MRPGSVVTAVAAYDGADDDELSFLAGERIVVLSQQQEMEGWCRGALLDDTTPAGCVPMDLMHEAGPVCTAHTTYEGAEDDELSFSAGDTIVLLEGAETAGDTTRSAAWRIGVVEEEVSPGLFPASYVEAETVAHATAGTAAQQPSAPVEEDRMISRPRLPDVTPLELWRELEASPLSDELLKPDMHEPTRFHRYVCTLALLDGTLHIRRVSGRLMGRAEATPHSIDLRTIESPRKIVYADSAGPSSASAVAAAQQQAGADFQFIWGVGEVMRLRAPTARRCSEWVRALTMVAGSNWEVLAPHMAACRGALRCGW